MKAISKFTRKTITQIITVYQGTLDIDLPEVGIKLLIKPNKDVDDMLDVINNELIKVCGEYLEDKNLGLDKYQLATICAQLMTLAMERCEEPFWVNVKTSKALVKEYLEANKSKREALERIKNENEALDKEILTNQQKQREKKVVLVEKPEMPAKNPEVGPMGSNPPTPKPKKKATRNVDALAVDDFKIYGVN